MAYTLKERVLADVKRGLERDRGSRRWLNRRALYFDHSRRLNEDQKDKLDFMLELLDITKRKENYLNLEILIANLLRKRDRWPVIVSLNTLDWKKTRYTRAGESTIKLIYQLNECGYIMLKKGYRNKKEPSKSRKSRIWPTDKLLEYF